eukprot:1160518-Pelagomonas_calceolata.AAC.1
MQTCVFGCWVLRTDAGGLAFGCWGCMGKTCGLGEGGAQQPHRGLAFGRCAGLVRHYAALRGRGAQELDRLNGSLALSQSASLVKYNHAGLVGQF